MNNEAQKTLNNILSKEIYTLVPYEIAFLKARRDYLTGEQRERYAEVIESKQAIHFEPLKTSYHELKKRAKELGLTDTRQTRDYLEKYIAEQSINTL